MRKTFILFLSLIVSSLYAQITLLEEYPFKEGEVASYAAIYEWGFLEIKAGEVSFIVDEYVNDNEPIFHFKSMGNSLHKYDWIYRVRDSFRSKVRKENFRPIYYQRNTSEGSYTVFNETYFDENLQLIRMELQNSEKGYSTQTMPLEADIFDLQTACYYARLLNFENAIMGEGYEFKIIIDGELYRIPIRYEGKEYLELGNDISYHCYRISTKVIEGTIFKSNQTIKIWVSDDGKNIPVKVEAPIKVGHVKAELIEYTEDK